MILRLIKNPNSNSVEATWIEEETKTISIIVEKEVEGELVSVKESKDITIENTIHCQSFSNTQMDLIKQFAKDFNTPLSKEQLKLIKEIEATVTPLTDEQLKEIEDNRILCIKSEAGRVINEKYPIFWQLNHPRADTTYDEEYKWIDNIRAISNKAELDGIEYYDIDWGI